MVLFYITFHILLKIPSLPYKLVAEIVDKTEWCIADTIMWKKNSGLHFQQMREGYQEIGSLFGYLFVKMKLILSQM